MKTVELPGGHTATLRDDNEMLGRGKRTMRAAMMGAAGLYAKLPTLQAGPPKDPEADGAAFMSQVSDEIRAAHLDASDWEALERLREASVVALFESWTLPLPAPTMETIGTLDGDTYDALLQGVGALPTAALSGFTESGDPETPTSDSASSDTSSKDEEAESTLIPTSSNAGSPTDGASSSPEPSETTSSS